jgi:hypothetical protein
MNPIESQEIRGLSVKALLTIIISTISIVASILATYNSIKSEIQNLSFRSEGDNKVINLRLSVTEKRLDNHDARIESLERFHNSGGK